MSVVPWWPLFSIILTIVSGTFLLVGLELVTLTAGVEVDRDLIDYIQAGGGCLVLLNLIFAYGVMSNKLRIHNIHACAQTCRGYRIKDAKNCCMALLSLFCKFYNLMMAILSWISGILAIVIATALTWISGCVLMVGVLCDVSTDAIQSLLDELLILQAELDETPVSDFITVQNGTNASRVCDKEDDLTRGGMYMLTCAPLLILAQVIMLVSYHVVAEVSWRHLKDVRKEEERWEQGGAEMGSSKDAGAPPPVANYNAGYGSQPAMGRQGTGLGPPNFDGPPSTPFARNEASGFGHQGYSSHNI